MLVVGGQTAGGWKNPVVFPAGRRTGAGSALDESPPPTGRGRPFWRTRPLSQERYEGAIVLGQLVEEHPVEARG